MPLYDSKASSNVRFEPMNSNKKNITVQFSNMNLYRVIVPITKKENSKFVQLFGLKILFVRKYFYVAGNKWFYCY